MQCLQFKDELCCDKISLQNYIICISVYFSTFNSELDLITDFFALPENLF